MRRPLPQAYGVSRIATLPAPTKGLNTRDSVSGMDPRYALQMDNIFPGQSECVLRGGSASFATGMTGTVKSLYGYGAMASASNKVFAVTDAGIYDITAGGAIGAVVQALTNGAFQAVNFTNSAGTTYLWGVNGTDTAKMYDSVGGWATPALTGAWFANSGDFANCWIHKRRIWVIKKTSMSVGFLPLDAIQGAVTEYPVGALFRRGGRLVAGATLTLDAGTGTDDLLVLVTSEGEVAIYQGTDPTSATAWGLIGVWFIGKPAGFQQLSQRRCLTRFGGDLLFTTESGIFPLSSALQSATINSAKAVTDVIRPTYTGLMQQYSAQVGWEATVFPAQNAILFNVPLSTDNRYMQLVMNSITGAWCTFSGWNSHTMMASGGALYLGLPSGAVNLAWQPGQLNDSGADIVGTVQQAFVPLGKGKLCKPNLIRPQLASDGDFETRWGLSADFDPAKQRSVAPRGQGVGGSPWDTSTWDVSDWSQLLIRQKAWRAASVKPGFSHSLYLQFLSKAATVTWSATDFNIQDGIGIS